MKPFRTKTTAAAIVACMRDGVWRAPSEIEEAAGLAWYSPLVLTLLDLKEKGVLERRMGFRHWGRVPEYRLKPVTLSHEWIIGSATVIRQ